MILRHLLGCIFAGVLACALSFGAARADDFTITYELNGGTNYVNAPTSYTEGTGATINGIPTKADNIFAGWCTDELLENCAMTQTIGTDATGDKTFYAKWTVCTACSATNATCSLSVVNNVCTYTTACESGYGNIQNNGAYNASCSKITCSAGQINLDGACATGKFAVKTTDLNDGDTFQFTMTAKGTFTVDCGDGGTLSSTASDVSGNTITRSNTTQATYTCTYSTGGVKIVTFDGTATGYAGTPSNSYTSAKSAIAFSYSVYKNGNYANYAFGNIAAVGGDLSQLFPSLGTAATQKPVFAYTFYGAGLTSVPETLFSGYTTTTGYMFALTFAGSSLTSIPENLFRNLQNIEIRSFYRTFSSSSISGYIPATTFQGLVANGAPVGGSGHAWEYAFQNSNLVTACPTGTLQYITGYEGSDSYGNKWNGKVSCVEPGYTVTYSCGDGATGDTKIAGIRSDLAFRTIPNHCTKANSVFLGWAVSGTNDIKAADSVSTWDYTENKTLTAQWSECQPCAATNASCEYTGISNNTCTYTTTCNEGYYGITNNGKYNASCSACGGNNYYCTGGTRRTVSNGYYSTGGTETTRTGQAQCTAGYYCTNGVQNECPSGYENSVAGASSQDQCYGSCTTANVEHSATVSGIDYYGSGQDACDAITCETGYRVKPGTNPNLLNLIGNSVGTITSTTTGTTGKFTVNYDDKGILTGSTSCTTSSNTSYFCNCNITGYTPQNGTLQSLSTTSTPLSTFSNRTDPQGAWYNCTNQCAGSCAAAFKDDTTYRSNIFGQLTDTLATCEANPIYNITYTMNGGTNYENAPATYTFGTGATINGVPTKAGSTFAGWCTDEQLQNCSMTQTIGTDATGDKTFCAKWTELVPKTYNITYTMNGGTNYENAPATYTFGTGTTINGVPTKAGSTFAGWCTDAELQNCAMTQTIATDATGDKTFYAKWTVCPACATINATCTLSVVNNTCTYTTACEAGYNDIQNNGAFNASCGIPTCIGATFYDTALAACTPCPTGYNVNTTAGKTHVTQCQTQCDAGTLVEFPGIYGYTHIEYLESDGSQYIDTDFTHPAGTTNVRGEIRIGTGSTKINKNVNFLGNQAANVGGYSVGWVPSVFKLWMEAGGGRLNSSPQEFLANSIHDLSFEITPDKRYLTADGNLVEGTHTGTIVTDTPIHLFDNGMHQTDQIFIGRMYYIKLYENGVLAHDFLPVRENATGRVGVYDTVTGRFFTNSGTGEFSYGDDVTTICENVGTGHYVGQQVVNFGSVGIKKACPAGTYSNIENATSLSDCIPCQGATYSTAPGAAICSTCPTGYDYNKTAGKTSVTQCQIHCDGGQYLPVAIVGPYTELEYIQTSGTQWINTGLKVSDLTNPIMSATMEYLDTTKGKQTGAVKEPLSFKFGISNSNLFLCQANGSNSEVTFGPADTNKHTFLLNAQNATCKMDDTTLNLSVGDLSALTANITVGSVSGNKTRSGNVKIYGFELISNNTVVRHLIFPLVVTAIIRLGCMTP